MIVKGQLSYLYKYRSFLQISERFYTKSSLAARFDAKIVRENEKEHNVGIFGRQELKTPAGFAYLNKSVRKSAALLVDKIISPNNSEITVKSFDDLSNLICCAADLTECVRYIHPDSGFVEAAEETMCDFTELVESLNTNRSIYDALEASLISNSAQLDHLDRRVLHLFLIDMKQSGVHLPTEQPNFTANFTWNFLQRLRFVALSRRIFETASLFCRNADQSQEEHLVELVRNRHQLARLTGFEHFSDRAQQQTLLSTAQCVDHFLVNLIESLRSAVEFDVIILTETLRNNDNYSKDAKLAEWDIAHAMKMHQKCEFGIDSELLGRLWTIGAVVDGFNRLMQRIYGLSLEAEMPKNGEVWSDGVHKLGVYRYDAYMGCIYCDFEARPNKMGGDCHYTIRCSKQLNDGTYQTPIVVLSLSLIPMGMTCQLPIYLSVSQAETLFHELGHAIHSMLGRTRYQHVAGTRCSTDMAEVPSNLMELFFFDSRVLTLISDVEQSISKSTISAILSSRSAFSALDTVKQAANALFDVRLHGNHAQDVSDGKMTTSELYDSIMAFALPNIERPNKYAWQHRFSHLSPYGAKYYSYLVARASASLIWNSQFKADPFSRISGDRWARVQSFGGEKPLDDLLCDMLGLLRKWGIHGHNIFAKYI